MLGSSHLAFAVALALALMLATEAHAKSGVYSVLGTKSTDLRVVVGNVTGALATAFYDDDTVNTTGWATLSLFTSPAISDELQMFAAGYLEGALTTDSIFFTYVNTMQGNVPLPHQVTKFLEENYEWMQSQIATGAAPLWYWEHVSLVLTQLEGMFAGYSASASKSQALSFFEFLSISAAGDIGDISTKYNISSAAATLRRQAAPSAPQGAHCSGLIKVTADFSELFVGHSTWTAYANMLRLFKSYTMPLAAANTAATYMMFSSFPATLTSTDDFFVTDAKLAIIETTNGINNNSLYELITPMGGVLSWIRTIVATRTASSSPQWVSTFVLFNSGTYNNQWMVVDYKLFEPGQPLPPNLLWIVETLPGFTEQADVTTTLALGYWPSYNVPYFASIYQLSGFEQELAEYGPTLCSYDLAARAMIFRRNQSAVSTPGQFQALMRYNDWESDPLSEGNAGLAISARWDLAPASVPSNPSLAGGCYGAIDSKMTSAAMMAAPRPSAWAQSGPTHDQQPAFNWTAWADVVHIGLPDVFDFEWVLMAL